MHKQWPWFSSPVDIASAVDNETSLENRLNQTIVEVAQWFKRGPAKPKNALAAGALEKMPSYYVCGLLAFSGDDNNYSVAVVGQFNAF